MLNVNFRFHFLTDLARQLFEDYPYKVTLNDTVTCFPWRVVACHADQAHGEKIIDAYGQTSFDLCAFSPCELLLECNHRINRSVPLLSRAGFKSS